MAKILVTGASGFIGKRLIATLLKQNHQVYALVRLKGTTLFPPGNAENDNPHLKIIYGDLRQSNALYELPRDIDAAYYLMHSMSDIVNNLVHIERQVAENFVLALQKTSVKQFIYLGGIIPPQELSEHLKSRLMVEDILKASGVPTTVLRASIIVGSGSASFEIIRDLVEVLPIMIAPKWVNSKCQPIAIRDVLFYLIGVLLNPACYKKTFDIGGPDILTFKEILLKYAEVRNLKRIIISVPVLTPRLSSYWLVLVTSVKFPIAYYLVESMKSDTYCRDQRIHEVLPHECVPYTEAINLAFLKISQNEVTSTWMDSWEINNPDVDILTYIQVPKEGVLQDIRKVPIKGDIDKVVEKIWQIGGKEGWYGYGWLWGMRGWMDKLLGGVGSKRGRRSMTDLNPGDAIGFWRVIKADKKEKHLILFAEMKLPGEAWLEFKVENDPEKGPILVQTATYRPKGLLGRLYWYSLIPFHYFIFGGMARTISDNRDKRD